MTPLEKAGHLAHAKSAAFQRRLDSANACIKEGLRISKKPYVSWSAGKDSTCMLWLALSQLPSLNVLFATCWETRLLHSNFEDCRKWFADRFPDVKWHELRYQSEREALIDDTGEEYADRSGSMVGLLAEKSKQLGFDGAFVGTRSRESGNRALSHRRFRDYDAYAIYQYTDSAGDRAGTYRICPMETWDVKDLGALITLQGLPLLDAYEEGGLESRTTLRLCPQAIAGGAVENLRRRDRENYNRMLQRSEGFKKLT